MEVECWGGRSKGAGHASSGVDMIVLGVVEAGESVQRVEAGGDGPWEGISHSTGHNVGEEVTGCSGPEVEAGGMFEVLMVPNY